MNRFAWILASLGLIACSGDKGGSGTDDTSGTTTCTVTIDETIPFADQTDFFYRSPLEIHFSDVDETADASLADSGGADVSGSTSWSDDGTVMYFTPSSALSPSADYTLSVDYCGGNPSVAFRTSGLGAEADTSTLVGTAFRIDLGAARFVEPEGVGSVLGSLLEQNILVGVTAADDSELVMIGAISVGQTDEQDMCNPTIEFPTASFSDNPYFQIGPKDTTISVSDISVEIQDLEVSGAFAADSSYFGGGVLGGTIDTRPLVDLVADGEEVGEGYICDLVSELGYAECVACPSGGDFCLTLRVDQIVAEAIDDSLVVLSEDDVAGNPDCGG